jgi:hypothetical protein
VNRESNSPRRGQEESTTALKEAQPKLAQLAPLAKELNEASNQFTEELKQLDAELGKLNLGFDVLLFKPIIHGELQYDSEMGPMCRRNQYLAYGRTNLGTWGLEILTFRISEMPEEAPVLEESKPLLSASRAARLAAAQHMGELLDEIARVTKEKLAEVKSAIAGASDAVVTITVPAATEPARQAILTTRTNKTRET